MRQSDEPQIEGRTTNSPIPGGQSIMQHVAVYNRSKPRQLGPTDHSTP